MKHLSLLIPGILCLSLAFGQTSGGPDAYGYIWKNSLNTDPDAPVYSWVDISSIGTPVAGLGDDNSVGPIGLGFPYHYYWSDYTEVYIGSNGYIGFQSLNISSAGTQAFPTMPTIDANNNFVAPMLSDLTLASPNAAFPNPGTVLLWSNSIDSCVITFDQVPFWNNVAAQWGGSNTFQVIFSAQDSSITFQYQAQSGLWDAAYNTATNPLVIGMENVTGNIGLTVSNNQLPTANRAIRFCYPDTVLLSVPDVSPEWVENTSSGGFFTPLNDPVTGQSFINNVGNTDLSNSTTATLNILNSGNTTVFTEVESVPALLQNTGQLTSFTQGYTPTANGSYTYRVTTSNGADINSTNDVRTAEMVVVDTSGLLTTLSYYGGSLPSTLNATSWNGGDGDDGVGVYYEPPFYPAAVTEVEVFLFTTGIIGTDGYEIRIYDDNAPPGQGTLLSSVTVPTVQTITNTWNVVSLPLPVEVSSGGFYVGWYQTGQGIQLAQETIAPFSRRGFEVLNNTWSSFRFNESQESLMRVTIEKACNIPGGISLGQDTTVCAGSTVTLDAGSAGATYLWSTGTGGQTLDVTLSGTYSVNVVDANGCSSNDTISVLVNPSPVVNLGSDFVGCQGDSLIISSDAAFASYQWSTGQTDSSIVVMSSNIYTLTVTDSNNCSGLDDISVVFSPLPIVNLGPDKEGCFENGGTVAIGSNLSGDFLWSTGETSLSIVVSQPDTIWLQVTDVTGCTGVDTILVIDDTPVIDLGADTAGCANTPLLLSAEPGFVSYVWSNGTSGSTTTVSEAGEYSVTVTNDNGCTATDTIAVGLIPPPEPVFTGEGSWGVNWGNWEFTNATVGATSYVWDFGDGVGASTDANPTYEYSFPGFYNVQLIATGECGSDTSVVQIEVVNTTSRDDLLFGDVRVYPSPNDGAFQIQLGERALAATTVSLYNLQGQLVYTESHSQLASFQELDVRLADPVPGLYLLQLSSEGVAWHYKMLVE